MRKHSTKDTAKRETVQEKKLSRFSRNKQVAFAIIALSLTAVSCIGDTDGCSDKQIQANQTVSEQLACIYDLVNSPSVLLVPESLRGSPTTYRAAMNSLIESGYLVEVTTLDPAPGGLPTMDRSVKGYYPTAEGMDSTCTATVTRSGRGSR